ncbi:MAG TPA: FHA domain-containing protein, partial [Myxococcaceae bacterium]|nr:FHA domain-containing protein [Myxococcaceae bacterium]
MFVITLAEKSGGSQQLSFEKNEVTIGRLAGNDIVLAKGNVSKYHSRLVQKDGKFIIVDMKSTNGTYVNGKKISAPQVIRPTDKIFIGDYIINVETGVAPPQNVTRTAAPPPEEEFFDDEGGEPEAEADAPYADEGAYEEEEPPPEEEEERTAPPPRRAPT